MADINFDSAGYSLDVTVASFLFNGASISAAVEGMDYNTKTDEEMTYLQGLQDAQERNAGQRSHDATLTWATRQWMQFCAREPGGINALLNREFTLTVIGRPAGNSKLYKFVFNRFRMHSPSGNIDKSAGKTKVECSYLSFDQFPVATSP